MDHFFHPQHYLEAYAGFQMFMVSLLAFRIYISDRLRAWWSRDER